MFRTIVLRSLAAAALASLVGSAEAATAYNSQAGAWGHDSNVCRATPYFPAGGCLASILTGDPGDLFDRPSAPYRPRRTLTDPAGLLPTPGR